MKKEILRFTNFNIADTPVRRLDNLNCYFLAGEITGALGLANSGKDAFMQLLTGKTFFDKSLASIYLHGKKIDLIRDLLKQVYIIRNINYSIKDLTLKEYCELQVSSAPADEIKDKLKNEVLLLLNKWGSNIGEDTKISEMREIEKRWVDLAKAISLKKSIIVIEDEFSEVKEIDIIEFKKILKENIEEKMTIIVSSNSEVVKFLLADKYLIFRKGKIVKKCPKNEIENMEQLEIYLLGKRQKNRILKKSASPLKDIKTEYFQYYDLQNMIFKEGEVVSFLVLDNKEKKDLFQEILEIAQKKYNQSKAKAVYVNHLGGKDEIFSLMSPEDNLLLPSLSKLSFIEYLRYSRHLKKMLKRNFMKEVDKKEISIYDDVNELIRLTLERWYIYRPAMIILYEPFIECDPYGVSLVREYIKRFADRKTAVIIIKSRDEYIADISDHIFEIKGFS